MIRAQLFNGAFSGGKIGPGRKIAGDKIFRVRKQFFGFDSAFKPDRFRFVQPQNGAKIRQRAPVGRQRFFMGKARPLRAEPGLHILKLPLVTDPPGRRVAFKLFVREVFFAFQHGKVLLFGDERIKTFGSRKDNVPPGRFKIQQTLPVGKTDALHQKRKPRVQSQRKPQRRLI